MQLACRELLKDLCTQILLFLMDPGTSEDPITILQYRTILSPHLPHCNFQSLCLSCSKNIEMERNAVRLNTTGLGDVCMQEEKGPYEPIREKQVLVGSLLYHT